MKFYNTLSKTSRIMLRAIGGLFFALLAIGLVISVFIYPFERPIAFVAGLFVGCALSVAKVILLEKALGRSFDLEGTNAKNYATLQSILRYVLTIAVLLVVVVFPDMFGLWGTILGVLTLQFSAYIANIVINKTDKKLVDGKAEKEYYEE